MGKEKKEWFTPVELATRWCIDVQAIHDMVNALEIKSIQIGKHPRIHRSEVVEIESKGKKPMVVLAEKKLPKGQAPLPKVKTSLDPKRYPQAFVPSQVLIDRWNVTRDSIAELIYTQHLIGGWYHKTLLVLDSSWKEYENKLLEKEKEYDRPNSRPATV